MRHRFARLLSIIGCALVMMGLARRARTPRRVRTSCCSPRPPRGYRHDSIPAGITMFEQLAAEQPVGADQERGLDGLQRRQPRHLRRASSCSRPPAWCGTTTPSARRCRATCAAASGIVAIHNATDMGIESQFPWWDQTHQRRRTHDRSTRPASLQGTARVADKQAPVDGAACRTAGTRTEEWYNFDRNARGNVHVLVTADERTYNPGPRRWAPTTRSPGAATPRAAGCGPPRMGHDDRLLQRAALPQARPRRRASGPPATWPATAAAPCGATSRSCTLDDNTVDPMALDVAPDGRVFYAQRGGKLKIYKPAPRTHRRPPARSASTPAVRTA